ncbi:MAG: hypothetical protein Q7J07_05015 [Pelolinea sp.]|nr:hypothetical protein [Pelolinea sp.]
MGIKKDGVNNKQELAINLVMCGLNDGEIASRVRVTRKTINTWRNHDEDFRALLAKRRKALHEQHQDELSGLVSEAIGVLREAMREENILIRVRAAQAVLRTSGLQTSMKAEKPTSQEEMMVELLSDIIGKAAVELGVEEAKRLGSGE